MKNYFRRILSGIKSPIICATLFMCFSCDRESIEILDPENPDNPAQAINSISTDWGSSPDAIRRHMYSYILVKDNNNTLVYKNETGESRISYKFLNDKLSASLLLVKNREGQYDFDNYLRDFEHIGNINQDKVYQSKVKNTIATTKESTQDDDLFTIGFAPLISEEYEKAEPLGVVSEEDIYLSPTKVTLYGTLTGAEKESEVGFMLSLSPEIDETNSRVIKIKSHAGRFEATISGILDQETYYYRAFALIDEIPYYGEVRSFETGPLTYTINGKEFQVIKVDGGPYGTFSILQTEITASDKITFGGIDLGINIDNDKIDGNISLYEVKKFIGQFCKSTGFVCRFPTASEWMFAAQGGLNSSNYIYSGSDNLDEVAWYAGNCTAPQRPATKKANNLDIYDMSGNYSELVSDVQIEDLESNIFIPSSTYYDFYSLKAYGGRWNSNASSCKINSYETPAQIEKYLLDGKKYAIRIVYSHHINSYN